MTDYEFLSLKFDFCRFIRENHNKVHQINSPTFKGFTILPPPFAAAITGKMEILFEMRNKIDYDKLIHSQEVINAMVESLKILKMSAGFYYENYRFDIEKYEKERFL